MAYKSEFQSNNIDLQNLINTTNNLPINENLSSELAVQKDLISQIATELQKKIEESEKIISTAYSCIATLEVGYLGFYGFSDIDGNDIEINSDGYTVDFSNYIGQLVVAHGDSNNMNLEDRFSASMYDENEEEVLGDVPVLEESAWRASHTDEYEWNWYFIVPKYNITIYHNPGDTG